MRILMLLLLSVNLYAQNAYEVFYTVLAESRFKPKDIKMVIIESVEINAYATEIPGTDIRYIYITTSILNNVDVDTLAFVIGHEIGHHSNLNLRYKIGSQLMAEMNADMIGSSLSIRAGYNRCGGYKFAVLNMMDNIGLEYTVVNQTHPKVFERMVYLKKVCQGKFK